MMISCPIPRKIYITKKPLLLVLLEFPAAVKPKTVVMFKGKLDRKLDNSIKRINISLTLANRI